MLIFELCLIAFIPSILGDGNDHIHIKLHLPELLNKHTHVKTVYKHHYHPKKTITTHSHLLKDSLGNNIESDASFSMLNAKFTSPKHSAIPHFDLAKDPWFPHASVEGVLSPRPALKSKIKPFNGEHNWDFRDSFSKYFQPKKPSMPDFQMHDNHEYNDDLADHMKEDDEDEEYTMTEDSVRELPLALQMQLKQSMMLRNNKQPFWNQFAGQPLQAGNIPTWSQFADSGSPSHLSDIDSMQRYEGFKNMQLQDNFKFEPPAVFDMKMAKLASKGKFKKKKRLNSSRSPFVYPSF